MVDITPKTGPRAVAAIVLNGWIDRIVKAINENEERTKHFEEPIPLPAFDIPKMIEATKELAKDAFLKRQQQSFVFGHQSPSLVPSFFVIGTGILNLARQHQKGRVPEDGTNVPIHDFTEGWFRTSGIYKWLNTPTRMAYI